MDKKQIIEDYLQGRHPMEQQSWEMPSAQELDNAEAEFDRIKKSLTPRPLRKERGLKFWPLAIAACLAGFVVIFLAPPRTADEPIASSQEPRVESQEPIASSQLSTVNCQLSTHEGPEPRVESQEPTASSQEPRVESPEPKAKSQQPTAKSQEPIAEPMQAEAEAPAEEVRPILPEMEDPFLAIAEQMQDIRSRGEQVRQEVAQLIDNKDNLQ